MSLQLNIRYSLLMLFLIFLIFNTQARIQDLVLFHDGAVKQAVRIK